MDSEVLTFKIRCLVNSITLQTNGEFYCMFDRKKLMHYVSWSVGLLPSDNVPVICKSDLPAASDED